MPKKIKNLYAELKKAYLGEKFKLIPEKYWSQFVCLGSASDWHYWWKKIVPPEKNKVLIVGIHGGRDYFYFKTAGYDIYGQDLFPDPDFGEMFVGNIENISLPGKFFDVILASAVIEHLANDFIALQNIRRALKDDGLFLNCFPLYNDWEKTHLHIYSEKTMERLMETAGFRIKKKFSSPNLFLFPQIFNFPNHALNALVFILFKKTIYEYTLPPFWKLEFFLSKRQFWFFRKLRNLISRINNGVEVLFVAEKSETSDRLDINKERFDTTKIH